MSDDLRGRVPVAGLADCQLEKPEVPLRVRLKRLQEKEKNGSRSLRSLWEEGERTRGLEREKEMQKEREIESERQWKKERAQEKEEGTEGENEQEMNLEWVRKVDVG